MAGEREVQHTIHTTNGATVVDKYPDVCPHCRHANEPTPYQGHLCATNRSLYVPFRCRKSECDHLFVGVYRPIIQVNRSELYMLKRLFPTNPAEEAFDEVITSISPSFVNIYNQALAAEQYNLSDIGGVGYRKALEFLIKDYLINAKNKDRAEIEKEFLGACITKHIDNQQVKTVAERATWLGNDETHYTRVWEDKDVQDLKGLIRLVLYWVESEKNTEELLKSMPSKGT